MPGKNIKVFNLNNNLVSDLANSHAGKQLL